MVLYGFKCKHFQARISLLIITKRSIEIKSDVLIMGEGADNIQLGSSF